MGKRTCLTPQEKLRAFEHRFYNKAENPWTPKEGDYYTTTRADLELYRIVGINGAHITTTYLPEGGPLSDWTHEEFLSADTFGANRMHVPSWAFEDEWP